ncbi:hypothetical protein [Streptomyces sp. NPDC001270]|uniref:hypothetical protein n=1 Tax=Streptomyces sp. NPDC001270 TaxID=3364554 RepID=UPI0036C5E583
MSEQPTPDVHAARLAVLAGRDALAFVLIRPHDTDPDNVTAEAGSRGMSRAAAAYALRQVADRFDEQARAEGDEPIPYGLTEQADGTARRVLTEDEFEAVYRAARGEFGMHGPRIGSSLITEAIAAALATVGILTPAPEADPETCSAMFADPNGTWHQCTEDPNHDTAQGHDSGDWSWPDAAEQAAPCPPAVVLTAADRQFLTFALDQAAEEMSYRDGFTDDDQAALDKLRQVAEAQPFTAAELANAAADVAALDAEFPDKDGAAEVTQLRARVAELEQRTAWLDALNAAGVDNWSGYDYARELYADAQQ